MDPPSVSHDDWAIWVLYQDDENHLAIVFAPMYGSLMVRMHRYVLEDGTEVIAKHQLPLTVL